MWWSNGRLARGGVGVEQAALAAGGHGHADGVGDALAQRSGGGLDAGGVAELGVAGGLAAPGAQRLEVLELEAPAAEVELDVQGEAGWPQDSTKRSRPGQCGSAGLCRITFWNSRYAAGARLMAVPGWPLPTFCTASMASDAGGVDGLVVEVGPVQLGGVLTSVPSRAVRSGDSSSLLAVRRTRRAQPGSDAVPHRVAERSRHSTDPSAPTRGAA